MLSGEEDTPETDGADPTVTEISRGPVCPRGAVSPEWMWLMQAMRNPTALSWRNHSPGLRTRVASAKKGRGALPWPRAPGSHKLAITNPRAACQIKGSLKTRSFRHARYKVFKPTTPGRASTPVRTQNGAEAGWGDESILKRCTAGGDQYWMTSSES